MTDQAPGAPGMPPRWTSSTKTGIGTAYNTSSLLWFTISHGIIDEIYYPTIAPNTRDIQFLVTDGTTFFHEERRDFTSTVGYPEKNALLYRLTNVAKDGRYRIIKEILTDPHSPVLLIRSRLEIIDQSLSGKLKLFVLLAPHIGGRGRGNNAGCFEGGGRPLIHAYREDIHLVLGSSLDFDKRSVGYVGSSDGWSDIHENLVMDWQYTSAREGNLALNARLPFTPGEDFTIAVGMGSSREDATTTLCQSLAIPFSSHRKSFTAQWQRTHIGELDDELCQFTPDVRSLFRLSRCILLAHEDKTFAGATIAALSIPWGESKGDDELGGYHLVWPRDMMHTAHALISTGQTATPLRSLIWLSCIQDPDGSIPQNSWINGKPFWKGRQLDEVAAPILLAWTLHEQDALREFNPWTTVSRAARNIILTGPVTAQERWEENSGYSPSTLAAITAGIVIASRFATFRPGGDKLSDFLLTYADWLSENIEPWTVTNCGELLPGTPRHYIRITPASCEDPSALPDPDNASLELKNGAGTHPARNIVDAGFLELVRLGLRDPHDPLVVESLKVIDHVLLRQLPQGPGYLRYNHDGYGQKADGQPFDGTGVGGCWPLLSGERGHYELAAGNDPTPYIKFMHDSANEGGMIPEQVWSLEQEYPGEDMLRGRPVGSAMPLCWSHAEFISLIRSAALRRPISLIKPAHDRYVKNKQTATHSIWTYAHQPQSIPSGKTLRIILSDPTPVAWWPDQSPARRVDAHTSETFPGLHHFDISPPQDARSIQFNLYNTTHHLEIN